MATTLAGLRLTERHRSRQIALRAVFLTEMHRLWPLLDPLRLDATAAAWLGLMVDLIVGFRTQSIGISLTYYSNFRTAETGAPEIDKARFLDSLSPADLESIRVSMFATGPASIRHRTNQGMDIDQAATKALVDASGAGTRQMLNGHRDALDTFVREDKVAIGYARVTSDHPCSFCAVLAGRGPVYKEDTAILTTVRANRGPGREYHDHCMCTSEAVYSRKQPWPGRARQFEQLWKDSTKGYGGQDALNAFRRAYRTHEFPAIPAQRLSH